MAALLLAVLALVGPTQAQTLTTIVGTQPPSAIAGGMRLDTTEQPTARLAPGPDSQVVVQLKFQIRTQKQRVFRNDLSASGITVTQGAQTRLPPDAISLNKGEAGPTQVIVALDLSGSMAMQSDKWVTSKLVAAKESVAQFIESLKPGDGIEILAFDKEVRAVYPRAMDAASLRDDSSPLGTDLMAASRAVQALKLRSAEEQNFTALFDAVEAATRRARRLTVPNVVLITDGMDDTPASTAPKPGTDECKASTAPETGAPPSGQRVTPVLPDRDARLAARRLALKETAGFVRIFTIGVGDSKAAPCALGWVDLKTLNQLSGDTQAGPANEVLLQDLTLDPVTQKPSRDALKTALSKTLGRIREALQHDYVLNFRLDRSALQSRGPVKFAVVVRTTTPEGTAVLLPLEFTIDFLSVPGPDGSVVQAISRPIARSAMLVPGVIVETSSSPNRGSVVGQARPSFAIEYAAIVMTLGLLALLPRVDQMRRRRLATRIADAAVVRLASNSPLIGKHCPNEKRSGGAAFAAGEYAVVCPNPECRTPHHIACWSLGEAHRCWKCRYRVKLSEEALAHKDD